MILTLACIAAFAVAIYWVASASYERGVENSADEVRVVEHPPGYYMPQWRPAGYDWWIDLYGYKSQSLEGALARARQHRDYLKASEEPERIHGVDEEGGVT